MEGSGRAEFATSKYAFWDIDYFKLVVFKKQDSGKTLDLSPNCIKRIKIEDLCQEERYHYR